MLNSKNLKKNFLIFAEEFAQYLRYARRLDFFEQPDYDYCHSLFASVMDRMGWSDDSEFDWTAKLNAVIIRKKKENKKKE